ncbi:MAG: phosphatase PAP2 family protein [Clostridia bacterium]|nr:phosphatase PAP2 family protein [Clostridia bacterium]
MYWEFQFLTFLQKTASPFFDLFWTLVTMFGEEVILVAIVSFLYWCFNKSFAKCLGYSVLTSITANCITKNIVSRDRPFQNTDWNIENKRPDTADGFSFPSGHTQVCTSLFVSMAIWIKKRWMWVFAITISVLVAFSRLYLGVHFPTDVIAGFALGILFSFLCCYLHQKIQNKLKLYLVTILIATIGLFFCTTEDFFTAYGLLVGVLGAFLFEEKYVNFTLDVSWFKKGLRLFFGLLIILALKEGLKIPFNMIADGNLYLRALRYAIASFCGLGLYPMLFKKFNF